MAVLLIVNKLRIAEILCVVEVLGEQAVCTHIINVVIQWLVCLVNFFVCALLVRRTESTFNWEWMRKLMLAFYLLHRNSIGHACKYKVEVNRNQTVFVVALTYVKFQSSATKSFNSSSGSMRFICLCCVSVWRICFLFHLHCGKQFKWCSSIAFESRRIIEFMTTNASITLRNVR